MKRFRDLSIRLTASLAFLAVVACGGAGDEPATPEAPPVSLGELVDVVLADGGVTIGVAVQVTGSDGTHQDAYFAGPRPLAEAASQGTWTFQDDALPARVRILGPDEAFRAREG